MTTIVLGPDAGYKWWSQANQKKLAMANRVAATGQTHAEEWYTMPDGTRIHVQVRNGRPQAFIYATGGVFITYNNNLVMPPYRYMDYDLEYHQWKKVEDSKITALPEGSPYGAKQNHCTYWINSDETLAVNSNGAGLFFTNGYYYKDIYPPGTPYFVNIRGPSFGLKDKYTLIVFNEGRKSANPTWKRVLHLEIYALKGPDDGTFLGTWTRTHATSVTTELTTSSNVYTHMEVSADCKYMILVEKESPNSGTPWEIIRIYKVEWEIDPDTDVLSILPFTLIKQIDNYSVNLVNTQQCKYPKTFTETQVADLTYPYFSPDPPFPNPADRPLALYDLTYNMSYSGTEDFSVTDKYDAPLWVLEGLYELDANYLYFLVSKRDKDYATTEKVVVSVAGNTYSHHKREWNWVEGVGYMETTSEYAWNSSINISLAPEYNVTNTDVYEYYSVKVELATGIVTETKLATLNNTLTSNFTLPAFSYSNTSTSTGFGHPGFNSFNMPWGPYDGGGYITYICDTETLAPINFNFSGYPTKVHIPEGSILNATMSLLGGMSGNYYGYNSTTWVAGTSATLANTQYKVSQATTQRYQIFAVDLKTNWILIGEHKFDYTGNLTGTSATKAATETYRLVSYQAGIYPEPDKITEIDVQTRSYTTGITGDTIGTSVRAYVLDASKNGYWTYWPGANTEAKLDAANAAPRVLTSVVRPNSAGTYCVLDPLFKLGWRYAKTKDDLVVRVSQSMYENVTAPITYHNKTYSFLMKEGAYTLDIVLDTPNIQTPITVNY